MSLLSSLAPDITESIPSTISARSEINASFRNSKLSYDVAIGGLPFLMAPDNGTPYQRQTAELRKQQIDTSKEAGEQTLDQWWTRSQTSWHRGEGINFYEPTSDTLTEYRYAHGVGIDPWTKGQIGLLHSAPRISRVSAGQNAYVATGGTGVYFTVENGTLKRRPGTAVSYTGATASTPPVLAGSTVMVGNTTGIWTGSTTGSTLSQLYSSTGSVLRPWWAKSRIIAAQNNGLFELPLAVTTPPAAVGTPFYSHPMTSWKWTAVADSPGAILAAGYSDGHSVIYKFALEDASSGSTPKLGQAYEVAEFPPGEIVYAIHVYLGQYIGIGTSRGIRVGIVSATGEIQYGPLIVETDSPVYDLAARDSFLYGAVTNAIDGNSGAVRINLGEEIETLRFAYAWDVQTHLTGNAVAIGFIGGTDRVVLAVDGDGIYEQSDTLYEVDGYVTTGKIRYSTTELKDFRRFRISLRTASNDDAISVFFRDEFDTERFIYRITSKTGYTGDATLGGVGPKPHVSFRLRLESTADHTAGPLLDAVLVKAVPAVPRQRLIQIPLLCFDEEADRFGAKSAVDGGAALRLLALEELESSSAMVSVQDFTSGESFEGQIEQINFTRITAPSAKSSGFGGKLTVTLRKV